MVHLYGLYGYRGLSFFEIKVQCLYRFIALRSVLGQCPLAVQS